MIKKVWIKKKYDSGKAGSMQELAVIEIRIQK